MIGTPTLELDTLLLSYDTTNPRLFASRLCSCFLPLDTRRYEFGVHAFGRMIHPGVVVNIYRNDAPSVRSIKLSRLRSFGRSESILSPGVHGPGIKLSAHLR